MLAHFGYALWERESLSLPQVATINLQTAAKQGPGSKA
jgi:hypothetical protein